MLYYHTIYSLQGLLTMSTNSEKIWAAADALEAAGKKPTLDSVRDALGGGSFTTISKAMAEWRTRKAEKSAPPREPAPTSLNERLQEFGSELWAAALELANGRLTSERELLESARIEIETSREEAVQLADQLAEHLEKGKAREEALQRTENELRTQIDELKQSLAAEVSRVGALTKELEQVRGDAERAREQEVARREDAATLRGQLQVLQQQNAELLKRLPSASS
jgi:DNA gyrase/topoisomerase IV subunit A